jgi:hypothetical protein
MDVENNHGTEDDQARSQSIADAPPRPAKGSAPAIGGSSIAGLALSRLGLAAAAPGAGGLTPGWMQARKST